MPGLRKHLWQYSRFLPTLDLPFPASEGLWESVTWRLYPRHWLPLSLFFTSGEIGHRARRPTLAPLRCEEHVPPSAGWGHGPVPASSTRGGGRGRRTGALSRSGVCWTPWLSLPLCKGLGLQFAGAGGAWLPLLLVLRDPRDTRHACEGRYFSRTIQMDC